MQWEYKIQNMSSNQLDFIFHRGIIKQKLLASEFISRVFQHHQYSNMELIQIWMNMFICIVGEILIEKREREEYVNFSLPQILRRLKPCAMICTLGSFCPRMSAKIRLLVLFPLQPEHVPFNGTSDQTLTSINQLISQESKLNMLYPKVGYFGCGNISILQPSKMLC